ncbi:MAG: RNA methyltransferase [Alphaproteobacteria bacterium]|nr:RNA methyltransferase [Alphaproteobacteria bacterium]
MDAESQGRRARLARGLAKGAGTPEPGRERSASGRPRGYFGVGVEGISKAMNLGAVMRTAHAFGASFVFTVGAHPRLKEAMKSDTTRTPDHVPYYAWNDIGTMALPEGCRLVGVELVESAEELPRFAHPLGAAYVLGRERGSLSPEMVAACDALVRIPTAFCVNVGVAAALVMYDRMLALGRRAERLPPFSRALSE